jgi:hypothetical protein
MASSLFCIIYNASRSYNEDECKYNITEEFYRNWCNSILISNKIINIDTTQNYIFRDFYQTDIYKLFRNKLINWCNSNLDDTVWHGDNKINTKYRIGDLLSELDNDKKYDVVFHIRLEDFVTSGEKLIIHPDSICKIIEELKIDSFCILSNKITTDFERNYMDYIKNKYQNNYKISFESNDLVTDFKIMNNAKILICSLSTICWCAGFLSKNIECVYFPKNRFPGWKNQTFSTIIENTYVYDNILCNEKELTTFFNMCDI